MAERRQRSISTRWTFRYALAIFVIVSAVSAYHYTQVVEKMERNAELLLRLQANELIGRLQQDDGDVAALESFIDRHAAMGYRVLRLGFRVFDDDGSLVLERGSFADSQIAIPDLAAIASSSDRSLIAYEDTGEPFPYFCMAVAAPGGGYVQVAIYTQLFGSATREIRNTFLLSVPIILMLTTGFGWVLVVGSLRPISDMTGAAKRIHASNLSERLPRSGTNDELDLLSETLNEMMDRIAIGVGRMERFTGDAAHELRAPVARLRNRLENALGSARDPGGDEKVLDEALHDVDQLSEMVDAMLRLAHSGAGLDASRVEQVALHELAADVAEFFAPLAEEDGIELGLSAGQPVWVSGDPSWLRQLIANLIDNAVKFTPEGGRVDVVVAAIGGGAELRVRDTGAGIPAAEQDRIFESFHRAVVPASKRGVGLGLSLAREIARMHQGEISVRSQVGKGAEFTVRLPRLAKPGSR